MTESETILVTALASVTVLCLGLITALGFLGWRRGREARLETVADTLRDSERRLRDFAEMASDWFWEQDADFRFTMLGKDGSLVDTGGRPIIGNRRWDLFDTSRAPDAWERHKQDVFAHRAFRDFRYDGIGEDGRIHHITISGRPVHDARGTFLGYRGIGRDITDEMEAAAELRRAKDDAEVAVRLKTAFLANMHHELRTPLNAIIGFSELLLHPPPNTAPELAAAYAAEINASGEHLLGLIDNVLEMSRIEAGDYHFRDEIVDLWSAVRSSLDTVRVQARQSDVRIEVPAAVEPTLVRVDLHAIRQVIRHVIANAVKFTPPGGTVSLEIRRGSPDEWTLLVADTGIGVDSEVLPDIIEPFRQADSSLTRNFGGAGLGLAIASRLLRALGGRLHIESAPNQGTTVSIGLPALPMSGPAAGRAGPGGGAQSARRTVPPGRPADATGGRQRMPDPGGE